MSGVEWLCLIVGAATGIVYERYRPGGVLELRTRLSDLMREMWRVSQHPAGRERSNVVPLHRGPRGVA